MEALATALGHIVLKLLSIEINVVLGAAAFIGLLCWLINETHTLMTAAACLAWALHLAVMLTVDIAKGGDRL